MGWSPFAWLFGEDEEDGAPPEPLVLGAELHCPYGLTNSHLIVEEYNIDINGLPGACVTDCIAKENIMPFGHCGLGVSCEEIIDLEEKWENPDFQKTFVNGKEIITTKSTIICRKMGMEITAVTSGQDGVFAMKWAAQQKELQDFEARYPGLIDILKDPYGSLYLDSDMYKMALKFLRDCVEKNGGELPLAVVYVPTSLEEEMMKAALVHLLPGIDSAKQESFLSVLEARSVTNNTYDIPGWDAHLLNEQMLDMLEADCAHTAELIEKEGFYRWSEEHKQSLKIVADSITDFTYALALYYSMMASQNQVCRKNNLMEKGANKLKNVLKKTFNGEFEFGKKTNFENEIPRIGEEWYEFFKEKYGADNVYWNINSVDDIFSDPTRLKGYTVDELQVVLGNDWTRGVYGSNGGGWKLMNGDTSIFYHPGGGKHGGSYYGISSGATGKIKVVNPETYIPLKGDNATIIYDLR